ncbi:DUF2254 domain-containing protein [bacterium]|nr:DUF2254 domain-containing protein [bacterium]
MIERLRRGQLPNWIIPAAYALAALVSGIALPRIETRFLPAMESGLSGAAVLAMLSAIASGMIALTGIVFSLAFVMVQFSATAYSPRLVLWLARDPLIWHAVGIFSATFLYALAAIGWVERAGTSGAPFLTAWFVIVLLLASVAMFIALIERISMLQIHRMLAFTGDHGRRVIEDTYPPLHAAPALAGDDERLALPVGQTLFHVGRPRALQMVNLRSLLAQAIAVEGTIVLVASVGDTLVEGTAILHVHGARRPIDEAALRAAVATGGERTFEQDPKYAIRLLVDIAIKALSPAVNDPTTAVQTLDHIEDLLRRLGSRCLEIGAHRDAAGVLRLLVPCPTWDDFLMLAFDEIRYCGATSVQVMRRMRALAADLIGALPAERHAALRHHLERLDASIARSFEDAEEKLEASVADRQGLGMPHAH